MFDVMSCVRVIERRIGPVEVVETLSCTNNTVVKILVDGQTRVLKIMRDRDIPVAFMAAVNEHLSRSIPVQPIEMTFEREADGFDGVLAGYVAGQSLFDLVFSGNYKNQSREILNGLREYLYATSDLPVPVPGFGPFKVSAKPTSSLTEFVVGYATKYWGRAADHVPVDHRRRVDRWLTEQLPHLVGKSAEVRTIPVDSNLKNFIVTPHGTLVTLNVPIVARSLAAQAWGALSYHLRHSQLHCDLNREATAPDHRTDFELWALLGVLSFHAGRSRSEPQKWHNWGSPVPLLDDLVMLLDEVESQAL